MIKRLKFSYFYRYLLWLILGCLSCSNSGETRDVSKSETLPRNEDVTIFLVAYGEGVNPESLPPNSFKFGCGDFLVPVSLTLENNEVLDLKTALNKLFGIKSHIIGSINLVNVFSERGNAVKVDSIYIENDTTVVEISGRINAGHCDDPRIISQLKRTINFYVENFKIKYNGSEENWHKLFDVSGE